MRVEESKYSIAEIIDWLKKRELVINNDYQRGGALWPTPAKSYFIDTILKDFPFPKVYFHEHIDRETSGAGPTLTSHASPAIDAGPGSGSAIDVSLLSFSNP